MSLTRKGHGELQTCNEERSSNGNRWPRHNSLASLQKEPTPTESAMHVVRKPQGVERSHPYANCHRCGGRQALPVLVQTGQMLYLRKERSHLQGLQEQVQRKESNLINLVETRWLLQIQCPMKVKRMHAYTMFQLTNSWNDPLLVWTKLQPKWRLTPELHLHRSVSPPADRSGRKSKHHHCR